MPLIVKITNNGKQDVILDKFNLAVLLDDSKFSTLDNLSPITIKSKQQQYHSLEFTLTAISLEKFLSTKNINIIGTIDAKLLLFDNSLVIPVPIKVKYNINIGQITKKNSSNPLIRFL